jgi:drug/metabolite transporter (DMT)-like permease
LFYVVPPLTALIAFFVFGESLGPAAILGMAIAVVGVALVVW